MSTRRERLSDLLRVVSESLLNPEAAITCEEAEQDMPVLMKELNALLDAEFVAGHDYAMDPTAPLLPGRNQRKAFYGQRVRKGPGRPRKSPELPPRPAGKHVSDDEPEEPDDGQAAPPPSAE